MGNNINRLEIGARVRLEPFNDTLPLNLGIITGYTYLMNEYGERVEAYVVILDDPISEEYYMYRKVTATGRTALFDVVLFDEIMECSVARRNDVSSILSTHLRLE